ncbi:autotransporter adhesin [Actinobacillus porcinus]|uniref:Autotransporter adhesin n=1 Tax=Actinobacillus porcinus TaxID=51048 RepID=A0ABY6THG6_9PAST|nr:ESPR domain-containing protein [Actinobacillus porcinus]VFY92364.1 autotransporter adhesin [Actinobacillus porcinus]VTU06366.1 autotransporter adhesin [Actinobacillus porcinus]
MNKIFKVIFNRATGKAVVVSELTKAHGKSASQTDDRASVGLLNIGAAATAAVLLGSMSVSLDSYAAIAEGSATGQAAIAIGAGSTASSVNATAVGQRLKRLVQMQPL